MLVYVYLSVGYSSPASHHHVKIYTEEGDVDYAKYIGFFANPHHAVNTDTNNIWLPMPSNRRLYVTTPPHVISGVDCWLSVTGYR